MWCKCKKSGQTAKKLRPLFLSLYKGLENWTIWPKSKQMVTLMPWNCWRCTSHFFNVSHRLSHTGGQHVQCHLDKPQGGPLVSPDVPPSTQNSDVGRATPPLVTCSSPPYHYEFRRKPTVQRWSVSHGLKDLSPSGAEDLGRIRDSRQSSSHPRTLTSRGAQS